jgi:hypothetical protein
MLVRAHQAGGRLLRGGIEGIADRRMTGAGHARKRIAVSKPKASARRIAPSTPIAGMKAPAEIRPRPP